MNRNLRLALPAMLFIGALGLAGCTAQAPTTPSSPPAAPETDAGTGDDTGGNTGDSGGGLSIDEDIPYVERLTPIANLRKATDIRVEGTGAWVTVPTASTDPTAMLECIQMLPASKRGDETLTVIFSDGVEELCEWRD